MASYNDILAARQKLTGFDRILDRSFAGYQSITGTDRTSLTASGDISFLDTSVDSNNNLSDAEMATLQNTIEVIKLELTQISSLSATDLASTTLTQRIATVLNTKKTAGENVLALDATKVATLLNSASTRLQEQIQQVQANAAAKRSQVDTINQKLSSFNSALSYLTNKSIAFDSVTGITSFLADAGGTETQINSATERANFATVLQAFQTAANTVLNNPNIIATTPVAVATAIINAVPNTVGSGIDLSISGRKQALFGYFTGINPSTGTTITDANNGLVTLNQLAINNGLARPNTDTKGKAINIAGVSIKSREDLKTRINNFANYINEKIVLGKSIPALGVLNYFNKTGTYAESTDWRTHSPTLDSTELTKLNEIVTQMSLSVDNPEFDFTAEDILSHDFFTTGIKYPMSADVQTSSKNIELLNLILKGPSNITKLETDIRRQKQSALREAMRTGLVPYTKEPYSPESLQTLYEVLDRKDYTQINLWTINNYDTKFAEKLSSFGDQYQTTSTTTDVLKRQISDANTASKIAIAVSSATSIAQVILKATQTLQTPLATNATTAEITAYYQKIGAAAIVAAAAKEAARTDIARANEAATLTATVAAATAVRDAVIAAAAAATPAITLTFPTDYNSAITNTITTPVTTVSAYLTAITTAAKATSVAATEVQITAAKNAIKDIKSASMATATLAKADLILAAKSRIAIATANNAATTAYATDKATTEVASKVITAIGAAATKQGADTNSVKAAAITAAIAAGASSYQITQATTAATSAGNNGTLAATNAAIQAAIANGASSSAAVAIAIAVTAQRETSNSLDTLKATANSAVSSAKTEALRLKTLAATRSTAARATTTADLITSTNPVKAASVAALIAVSAQSSGSPAEAVLAITTAALDQTRPDPSKDPTISLADIYRTEVALAARNAAASAGATTTSVIQAAVDTAKDLGATDAQIYAASLTAVAEKKYNDAPAAGTTVISGDQIAQAVIDQAKLAIPGTDPAAKEVLISDTKTQITGSTVESRFTSAKAYLNGRSITDEKVIMAIFVAAEAKKAAVANASKLTVYQAIYKASRVGATDTIAEIASMAGKAINASSLATKDLIKDTLVTAAKSNYPVNSAASLFTAAAARLAARAGADPYAAAQDEAQKLATLYGDTSTTTGTTANSAAATAFNTSSVTVAATGLVNTTAAIAQLIITNTNATEADLKNILDNDTTLDATALQNIARAALAVRADQTAQKERGELARIFKLFYAERNLEKLPGDVVTNPLSKSYSVSSRGSETRDNYQEKSGLDLLDKDKRISLGQIESLVPLFLELNNKNVNNHSYLTSTGQTGSKYVSENGTEYDGAAARDAEILDELSFYADLLQDGLKPEDLFNTYKFILEATDRDGDTVEDRKALVQAQLTSQVVD